MSVGVMVATTRPPRIRSAAWMPGRARLLRNRNEPPAPARLWWPFLTLAHRSSQVIPFRPISVRAKASGQGAHYSRAATRMRLTCTEGLVRPLGGPMGTATCRPVEVSPPPVTAVTHPLGGESAHAGGLSDDHVVHLRDIGLARVDAELLEDRH